MKLRTKTILFFGTFLFVIALAIFFYAKNYVGGIYQQQAINDVRIITEQSESAYLAFLGSLKVRVLDWTSDNTVRTISKAILNAPAGTSERARLAKEFTTYVNEKKMPFDKAIFLTDLLDKNGVVIASTRPERIGKDERSEEQAHHKVHDFDGTINSQFGEVFFGTIILNGDNYLGPTLNVAARLFDVSPDGNHKPIDAVLLVYYSNITAIANMLGSGASAYAGLPAVTGRKTSGALFEGYKTSDLYLVNNERYLVTHSRTVKDVYVAKQKVDTLPVRECLENGKEISEEYDNYQGVRVLGSSMCFQKEGIVVLMEVQKDEIFAPLTMLVRVTAIGGTLSLAFGILIIILFIRRPLARINDVVLVAKQVAQGDLDTQVEVGTNDELGYLATSFNAMIASVRNTQKELRAEKNKAEEEKKKDEALLAGLGEGMIATDNDGIIIKINNAAEKMLGLKSADVIGKKLVDAVEALDENNVEIPDEQRIINSALKGATSSTLKYQYKRKNDGYFPIALIWTPAILDGKVIGAIGVFRDITREKEIEKTRVDLLSLASHQLRTPLSGTKWLIETLKRGLHGPLTPGQAEYLDEIYKINERMTSLVHDMLDVLRMEGDSAQAKKESVSTKKLLSDVFETLHSTAESKQITVRIPESADFQIETDPVLLENILESVVANAINYSESGRDVVVSVEQKNTEFVFAVKDSGIGIPKDEQRQIFERFYRASNAKIFDTRGSGLGLYIATTLAKKIGATLSFESEVGKGSTFYVHIPYSVPGGLPENVARV
ncbi:MAG: PAS domain-containing protein [Candidatus Yonathbacteria bacterium]|nr:PAS domain-containing protein [Candidatus Yonathbacteria bacterium]